MQPIVLLIHLLTADAQILRSSRDLSGAIEHISNGDKVVTNTAIDKLGAVVSVGDSRMDLITMSIPTGANFYSNLDEACYRWNEQPISTPETKKYSSLKELEEGLSNEVSIKGNYGPVSASLTNKYSQSHAEKKFVLTITSNRPAYTGYYSMEPCKKEVRSEIIEAFRALPTGEPPHLYGDDDKKSLEAWREFWTPYKNFLNSFGTHVINEVTVGGRVQLWYMLETDEEEDISALAVELCIKANGGTKGASACNNFGKTNRSKSKTSNLEKRAVILGGPLKTHTAIENAFGYELDMQDSLSPDLEDAIAAWKNTVDNSVPVKYSWKPVWKVILDDVKHDESKDLAERISGNMEAYFLKLYKKLDEPIDGEKLQYCVEGVQNKNIYGPLPLKSGACICGKSTVCVVGEVCAPKNCLYDDDWDCAQCIPERPRTEKHYNKGEHKLARGEGECKSSNDCQQGLSCGHWGSCLVLRDNMGLNPNGYKPHDACCYNPDLDKYSGQVKSIRGCNDRQETQIDGDCLRDYLTTLDSEHGEYTEWRNFFPSGTKLTCKMLVNHDDIRDKADKCYKRRTAYYQDTKRSFHFCCQETCDYCAKGEGGELLKQ